jgi:iron complex outermembrane receptor protein
MKIYTYTKSIFLGSLCAATFGLAAFAEVFNVPSGDLEAALDAYTTQTGVALIVSDEAVKGIHTKGAKGELSPEAALSHILSGTGFIAQHHGGKSIAIVRENARADAPASIDLAATAATSANTALETVTVTSSKIGGDVQNIPISITALSQEQLTATQTAGGPDLVKQVPNMTFTKTNFSGYSIQLRGIGTQAISVTTDPAVAVAFNDIPFIRNHFFEQEFYDVSQVEVLRGPQGTLYGRNATAGVVNLNSAKPTDQFEAMASLEVGNYGERRPEGMINIPIVDDRLDVRIAGEWTKRQGYSFNALTDSRIDGRDLWSGRVSIGWKPFEKVQANLVWEHFSEDDDRMRTAKQLCKTDPGPSEIDGIPVPQSGNDFLYGATVPYLTQGCLPVSPYSPQAFEVPNALGLPYVLAGEYTGIIDGQGNDPNAYLNATQSRNLRVIESQLDPAYKAKNDVVELNADWDATSALTATSQSGFDHDFLWSTEDYNRFATRPNYFTQPDLTDPGTSHPVYTTLISPNPSNPNGNGVCVPSGCDSGQPGGATCTGGTGLNGCLAYGLFCDPQLGCSDRLVAQDLSDEHAWQLSQEFRLASNFNGPLNFSVGGNFLHYETEENYYVFINTLTAYAATSFVGNQSLIPPWNPGSSDNHQCLALAANGMGYAYPNPQSVGKALGQCIYVDTNSIPNVNNQGHNYFLSQNPYLLDSYAAFGEIYYNLTSDLKLTGGLRWTDDKKHFTDIPSELLVGGYGYPVSGVVNQQWDELTGRAVANWTPKLDFTDQTLIYGSYSHGYKAGGANPPGAVLLQASINGDIGQSDTNPIHPLTFKPEFIDAFELGSKNTLLDGALTLNADVFYYNYENYQISEIVDRSAINLNFDAHVKGAEAEATWEPLPGLRFNFAGGWEDTALAKGSQAVDLMDRTAGNPDWVLVKPFITQASNCILPAYVVAAAFNPLNSQIFQLCAEAYQGDRDPITNAPYVASPTINGNPILDPLGRPYPGFDPATAPNDGQGFDKDLSGKELPNAPPFTVSFGTQYTIPITQDWAATLRGDYYWQDYSWARVFNDNPYDRLRGYTNVNLTLIFTNQNGWQVMLYDKNVFDTTAITGDFLNSDDSGLTTNVFLTDPKLIGVRITKNW